MRLISSALRAALALGLTIAFAHPATAQSSARPLRLVVPFPAGDALDASARTLADQLAPLLSQPVIVDNRPGAGGNIAAEAVARAPADGYTIMYATTAMLAITPYLRQTPYDPEKDFDPVARVSTISLVVAVNADHPAKTWAELVTLSRQNPGKYTWATPGDGTLIHLMGEQLQTLAGVRWTHVPYKGMGQAVSDFLAGQINVYLEPGIVPQANAGKARLLAILADTRLAEAPAVPTLREAGLPFETTGWFGIVAPRGTPGEAIARLSAAIRTATGQREFASRLPPAVAPAFQSSSDFAATVRNDRQVYQALIKRLDLKLQ
jgi:tripartite-type tricarboxylate transporter receptor subunit TctC